jgi:hypothetical protein
LKEYTRFENYANDGYSDGYSSNFEWQVLHQNF